MICSLSDSETEWFNENLIMICNLKCKQRSAVLIFSHYSLKRIDSSIPGNFLPITSIFPRAYKSVFCLMLPFLMWNFVFLSRNLHQSKSSEEKNSSMFSREINRILQTCSTVKLLSYMLKLLIKCQHAKETFGPLVSDWENLSK